MNYSDLLKVANNKISYFSKYLWESYGPADIHDMGRDDYLGDNWTASAIVAHAKTPDSILNREVREVTICDDTTAYRWRDPAYVKAQTKEAKQRGENNKIAFDNVKWTEIGSEQEILNLLAQYIGGQTAAEEKAMASSTKERFTVKFDHRYVLEVQASSMDEARNKADQWLASLTRRWDSDQDIIFMDNYTVKEQVERERE